MAKSVQVQDGGWAWMVVIATLNINIITVGMELSFGIYFIELLAHFGESRGTTAWIGSFQTCAWHLGGPFISMAITRYGPRRVAMLGGVFVCVGLVTSGFCTELYQLDICFGVIPGLGFGLMHLSASVSVIRYFNKRRSLATGIASCGAGIGTFLFNPLSDILISEYGWRGALLIEGGILLNGVCFGALLRPLPSNDVIKNDSSSDEIIGETDNDFQEQSYMYEQEISFCKYGSRPCVKETAKSSPVEYMIDDARRYKKFLQGTGTLRSVQGDPDRASIEEGIKQTENGTELLEASSGDTIHLSDTDACDIVRFDKTQRHPAAFVRESTESTRTLTKNDPSTPVGDMATNREHETNSAGDTSANTAMLVHVRTIREGDISSDSKIHRQRIFNIHLIRKPKCLAFLLAGFLINLAFSVPFNLLPDWALEKGFTNEQAVWLVSTLSLASIVSRCALGWLADKPSVNRVFLFRVILLMNGVFTMISPLCRPYWAMMLYAALFGALIGGYVMLCAVVLADLFGPDLVTDALGLFFVSIGLGGLLSTPLAGWIFDSTGSYSVSFIVAGVEFCLSGLVLYTPDILRIYQT